GRGRGRGRAEKCSGERAWSKAGGVVVVVVVGAGIELRWVLGVGAWVGQQACLLGWLGGWLGGWLAGWLAGWLVRQLFHGSGCPSAAHEWRRVAPSRPAQAQHNSTTAGDAADQYRTVPYRATAGRGAGGARGGIG
ncbi:hypothetical protein PLESTB_001700400, partial [Pleodorina starrii]